MAVMVSSLHTLVTLDNRQEFNALGFKPSQPVCGNGHGISSYFPPVMVCPVSSQGRDYLRSGRGKVPTTAEPSFAQGTGQNCDKGH